MRDIIKGNTTEEKFASLNVTLAQMMRRQRNTVYILTPPIPLSEYRESTDIGGVIFSTMLSCAGTCRRVNIFIQDEGIKEVNLNIVISSGLNDTARIVRVQKGMPCSENISRKFNIGDRITCRLLKAEADERDVVIQAVSHIWISFLFDIDKEEMKSEYRIVGEALEE